MISSAQCTQNAQNCQTLADNSADPGMAAEWSGLAGHWRDLASDETEQATLARLLHAGQHDA